MPVAAAIALAFELLGLAKGALAAGKTDISEADLDKVLDEVAASDAKLSDAIARAKARRGG